MGKHNNTNYSKVCQYCGAEFIAHDKRTLFCSKRCKDISGKIKRGVNVNTNIKPYVKICKICGNEFETYRETVKCCSSECIEKNRSITKNRNRKKRDSRYKYTWDEYVSKVKEEAENRKAQKEKEKAINNTIRIIWAIAEKKKDKYCAECGSVFHSEYPNKIYCSDKCQRKHRDRLRRKGKKNSSIRRRCRKYGAYYDPAVTRKKVIERDNGICQICGKVCDPFDLRWGFSGPNFPTLDHIIALANGGNHTWDNVQCACGECNSYKRDLTEERKLEWLGLGKL